MMMEAALALLALSAPVTAAIITRTKPDKIVGVSRHEFLSFVQDVRARFDDIKGDIREIREDQRDRG